MLVVDEKPFVFDHIFNEESQENFYSSLIYPMVTKLLEGYHCTVMAYGHTGTGKTHTMGSGINVIIIELYIEMSVVLYFIQ